MGVENNGDLTPALSENVLKLMGGKMTADEFVKACKTAAEK
ncbi:hypothetical protein [Suipraeoptans intestinalis]|nr:hypothetical protein [Suipraeoptans intestinalis]